MCRTERLTVLALTTARRYGIVTIKTQHINTCRPGALKTQVLENASMEKASTKQRISQVRKTQVRVCRDGKRKYGKCKYNANLQSDKKKFGTSQVSVVHF